MNMLIDKPPTSVDVGGKQYEIHSDFRTAILYEMLMLDTKIEDAVKPLTAIHLYYPVIPDDLGEALEGILWFYKGGEEQSEGKESGRGRSERIYSFEYDDKYIYAAFLSQYGIDLQEMETLHWWKFKAMFSALEENTEIRKIMGYRAVEITSKMSQGEKEFYTKMKEIYRIPLAKSEQEKLDELTNALLHGKSLKGLI